MTANLSFSFTNVLKQLQNAGPESRRFCLVTRLAQQWIKEQGIICMTLSLGFMYLTARLVRLARQWME